MPQLDASRPVGGVVSPPRGRSPLGGDHAQAGRRLRRDSRRRRGAPVPDRRGAARALRAVAGRGARERRLHIDRRGDAVRGRVRVRLRRGPRRRRARVAGAADDVRVSRAVGRDADGAAGRAARGALVADGGGPGAGPAGARGAARSAAGRSLRRPVADAGDPAARARDARAVAVRRLQRRAPALLRGVPDARRRRRARAGAPPAAVRTAARSTGRSRRRP